MARVVKDKRRGSWGKWFLAAVGLTAFLGTIGILNRPPKPIEQKQDRTEQVQVIEAEVKARDRLIEIANISKTLRKTAESTPITNRTRRLSLLDQAKNLEKEFLGIKISLPENHIIQEEVDNTALEINKLKDEFDLKKKREAVKTQPQVRTRTDAGSTSVKPKVEKKPEIKINNAKSAGITEDYKKEFRALDMRARKLVSDFRAYKLRGKGNFSDLQEEYKEIYIALAELENNVENSANVKRELIQGDINFLTAYHKQIFQTMNTLRFE